MPKFKVTMEETAVYIIEVEAKDEDDAFVQAEEIFVQSEDRDKFFHHVDERDCIAIMEVK